MTERLRVLDDDALGRALIATAERIAWPAAPDLVASVSQEIRDRERRPSLARPSRSLPSRRRTLLLVVVGVLVLAAAAVAAKVVLELGALTIDKIPGRPTALPSAIATGPTLGHPATLPDAEQEAGFSATLPGTLGTPEGVWVDHTAEGSRIILAWSATEALPAIEGLPWGAVIYEFRGDTGQAAKTVYSEGNTFGTAKVDGRDAYWITGEHELDLVTGDGTYARYRVTGNILVWEVGGTVCRMETELSKSAAVQIASSIGPGT